MKSFALFGKKKAYDATALAVIAVLFVALIVVVTFLFRGARIDLTENRLYTIAPGTKRVVSSLDEPINLYFYFSQEPSRDIPSLRAYAQRVREMLEEMVQRSNGKLRLSVIDPETKTAQRNSDCNRFQSASVISSCTLGLPERTPPTVSKLFLSFNPIRKNSSSTTSPA
jgi:ABC-type uncharacterized transport system involved in gliding motility auxiliary subunit